MKRRHIILLLCSTLLTVLFVRAQQVKSKSLRFVLNKLLSHKVPEIDVKAASTSPAMYTFLDARENEEYQVSHLPNATFVGYKNFNIASLNTVPKNKPIVVYCSIGKRSEDIAEKIIQQGYTRVYNLYGGIFEWVNEDNVVYDVQNKPTKNVHAYNWVWGRFLNKGNKVY